MAKSVEFNPRGTFVASKSGGLILASREYKLGDTIDKTGISRRKLAQLWAQGRIAYSWMIDPKKGRAEEKTAPVAKVETKVEKKVEAKTEPKKVEVKAEPKKVETKKVDTKKAKGDKK